MIGGLDAARSGVSHQILFQPQLTSAPVAGLSQAHDLLFLSFKLGSYGGAEMTCIQSEPACEIVAIGKKLRAELKYKVVRQIGRIRCSRPVDTKSEDERMVCLLKTPIAR